MESTHNTWDDTAPYYGQLADLIKSIAQSHHNITIDGPTLARWRDIMGLMREIDTYADDTGADSATVLDKLRSFDEFHERYPTLSPEIAGDMHDKLLHRADDILSLGKQVANATISTQYIRLRAREGMYTAHLFADTASSEVVAQPSFGNFIHTLRALGASASLIDSSVDLAQDYHSGTSNLPPSFAQRRHILGAACYYTKDIARAGSHWPVLKEVIRAVGFQAQRKLHSKKTQK